MWPLLGPKPASNTESILGQAGAHSHNLQGAALEEHRRLLADYYSAQTNQYQPYGIVSAAGAASGLSSTPTRPGTLKGMPEAQLKHAMAMRLRYGGAAELPVEFLSAYAVSDDKVIVLIVRNGQHTVLEDGVLFPSDTFISQVRLILEA